MRHYISNKAVCKCLQLEFILEITDKRFNGINLLSSHNIEALNNKIIKKLGPENIIDSRRILHSDWRSYYIELKETKQETFSILNKYLEDKKNEAIERVKPKLKSYLAENPGLVDNPEEFLETTIDGIENEFTKLGMELLTHGEITAQVGPAIEAFTKDVNAGKTSPNKITAESNFSIISSFINYTLIDGDSSMNFAEHISEKLLNYRGLKTRTVNEKLELFGSKDHIFYNNLTHQSLAKSEPPANQKYRDISDPEIQSKIRGPNDFHNPIRVFDGTKSKGYGKVPTDEESKKRRIGDLSGKDNILRMTYTQGRFVAAIQDFSTLDLRTKTFIRSNVDVGNANDADTIYSALGDNWNSRHEFSALTKSMLRAELFIFDRMMNNQHVLYDLTRAGDYFIAATKSNATTHEETILKINRVLEVVDCCIREMQLRREALNSPLLLGTLIQKGIEVTKVDLKLENFRFFNGDIMYSRVAEYTYLQGSRSIFGYDPNNVGSIKAHRLDIYLTSIDRIKTNEEASNKLLERFYKQDGKSFIVPEVRSVLSNTVINADIYDQIKNLKIDENKVRHRSIKNSFTVMTTNCIHMDPLTVIKLYRHRNDIEVAFYDETTYFNLERMHTHRADAVKGRVLIKNLAWNVSQSIKQKLNNAGVEIDKNNGQISNKLIKYSGMTLHVIMGSERAKLDMNQTQRALVEALTPLNISDSGCVQVDELLQYLTWKPSASYQQKHAPKKVKKSSVGKTIMNSVRQYKSCKFSDMLSSSSLEKIKG